jgi:hypothetical protein
MSTDLFLCQANAEIEDDDNEDVQDNEGKSKSSLPWLMSRMSFVARNLILNRPAAYEQVRIPVSSFSLNPGRR